LPRPGLRNLKQDPRLCADNLMTGCRNRTIPCAYRMGDRTVGYLL
jgi:hypothetical protein